MWKKLRDRVNGGRPLEKKSLTFGTSLEDRINVEHSHNHEGNVPLIVQTILAELGSREACQGLFREVGNVSKVNALIDAYNNERQVDLREVGTNELSSLLKHYFRDLPEPIFLYSSYDKMVTIGHMRNEDERVRELRVVLDSLPPVHHDVLMYLLSFLVKISKIGEYAMDASNLAICWAPTLISPEEPKDPSLQQEFRFKILQGMGPVNNAFTTLINRFTDISDQTYDEHSDDIQVLAEQAERNIALLESQDTIVLNKQSTDAITETINKELTRLDSRIAPQIMLTESMEMRDSPTMKRSVWNEEETNRPLPSPNRNAKIDNRNEEKVDLSHLEEEFRDEIIDIRDDMKKEIVQLRDALSINESITVQELKNLWLRLDTVESYIQTSHQQETPSFANADALQEEVKNIRDSMAGLQSHFTQLNERLAQIEYEHLDINKRIEDMLKEQRYNKIRVDYDIEHMKRLVEGHSTKLRDVGLDITTMKSKMEMRMLYNSSPLLKPRETSVPSPTSHHHSMPTALDTDVQKVFDGNSIVSPNTAVSDKRASRALSSFAESRALNLKKTFSPKDQILFSTMGGPLSPNSKKRFGNENHYERRSGGSALLEMSRSAHLKRKTIRHSTQGSVDPYGLSKLEGLKNKYSDQ